MQELLGHADVKTTMIYTHAAKLAGGVKSPLDSLDLTATRRTSMKVLRTLREMPA